MAVVTIQQSVAALYVAVFNRAPDQAGLNAWTNAITSGQSTFAQVAAGFAAHEVFTTGIGALSNTAYVAALYTNILGSAGDAAGIANWTAQLNAGQSKAAVAALFVQAALTVDIPAMLAAGSLTAAEAAAATVRQDTLTNKANTGIYFAETLKAASNLNPLTVQSSKAGLEADPIYNASKAAIANVTNTAASVQSAKDAISVAAGTANPAQSLLGGTFTLTTGVDTLVGGASNDTFSASVTDGATPTQTLGGLDSIDGGTGIDTLNVNFGAAAATLPTTATIKNVEVLNVTSNVSANIDVSNIAGLDTVKVSNASTTGGASVITGGKIDSVTGGGAATVRGDALTSVTATKTGVVTVNNTVVGAGIAGTTLTAVTLDDVTGAIAGLNGNGINTVTVQNQSTALATTVTNAVGTALTVNASGVGYTAAGVAVGVSVAAGAAATAITVNATGAKSNLTVSGALVTNVNITGTADLTLGQVATATTINGSAAAGSLTLGTLAAGTTSVKTGAGADSFTLAAVAKATVDTGAGNDSVTLTSALAAGSTVALGAGDDKLLSIVGSGSVAASTATAVTVIDAGAGFDTVSASLINATNAKQFVNFEALDLSVASNLDVALMTGSTISALTLSGGLVGGGAATNVAAGVGLSIAGNNAGVTTVAVKDAATTAADTFGITFNGVAAAGATALVKTTVAGGTVVVDSVETVNIVSGGTGFVANGLTLTDSNLKALTVTGAQDLALGFAATTGTIVGATGGVASIDGSAATGKLSINLANVTGAAAGLTVKGGAADDTFITGATATTLTGGAGKDTFTVSAAKGGVVTTITDFTAGDNIITGAANGAVTKITLDSSVTNLNQALALATANAGANWFQYGSDTYFVASDTTAGVNGVVGAAPGPAAVGDVIVKISGVVDLSTAVITDAGLHLVA